jgi:guanylate kinase
MIAASAISDISPTPHIQRRGMMLVLAAPPGGGKTTITREIMRLDPDTSVSVSATTREIRPGEAEGQHYYFVSPEKFKSMIDAGDMLEHALVYNNCYYGTPRKPVEAALSAGRDVLFDIDWQGMKTLKAKAPDDVVSIFILPPSWQALSDRLHNRARDSEDDIQKRLSKARDEMSHYREFDYVVINNDLSESIDRVRAIITAERARRTRQTGIDTFVEALQPDA